MKLIFPLLSCFLLIGLATARADEQETVITSRTLDSRSTETETITIFSGEVVLTGTNLRITCDHVEVTSLRFGDKADLVAKQNRFKSLIATGRVKILQSDSNREATCGRAEVFPGEDRVVLTENPMVIDRDEKGATIWTWIGDQLLLLRGEGRVHGKNVRVIGPPIKDLGFDKNQVTAPSSGAPVPEPAK